MRSRKDAQLNKNVNASSVCNPQGFLADNQLDPGLPFDGDILPCGLIAWSQFNDTFSAQIGGQNLPIDVCPTIELSIVVSALLERQLQSLTASLGQTHPRTAQT